MAQALPFPADIEKLTEATSSARRRELLDAITDILRWLKSAREARP